MQCNGNANAIQISIKTQISFKSHFIIIQLSIMASSPLLFLTILISATAAAAQNHALTLPLHKDPKTSQLYTTFQMGSRRATINAVVDLGGRHLWISCDNYTSTSYAPVHCDSPKCPLAGLGGCISCDGPARPGCATETCGGNPSFNPFFTDYITNSGYFEDSLLSNRIELPQFMFSCVSNDFRNGLARGNSGILGLGMNVISIHKQAANKLYFPDKFWICPASTGPGKLSIGSGIPKSYEIEVKSTKLIINPNSTASSYTEGDPSEEYFIGVKAIKVAGTTLAVKSSYFSFDKDGYGGTKLSTVQNYTSLHSTIYRPFARAFDKAASNLKMKSVAAVAPFRACYSTDSVSRTAAGPVVPAIDLILPGNDVYWRISGANAMVEVDRKTMCLAFVDGGSGKRPRPRTSVVIGVHQLEDNLLEFDVGGLQLKFSSSLLVQKKSCSRL